MNRLTFEQIKAQQLVDLRDQHAFQTGHLKKSINMNPKNFQKFGSDLLSITDPFVFVVDSEIEKLLDKINEDAMANGFQHVEGYIHIDEVAKDTLETSRTISAKAFLNKEDENYILLDVRNQTEVTRPAPEKNLVTIFIDDLPTELNQLDQTIPIYTICGSGNSSTSAASYLATKGYHTIVISGGMKAIQRENEESK